jgi:hypothetical protein
LLLLNLLEATNKDSRILAVNYLLNNSKLNNDYFSKKLNLSKKLLLLQSITENPNSLLLIAQLKIFNSQLIDGLTIIFDPKKFIVNFCGFVELYTQSVCFIPFFVVNVEQS